MEDRVLLERARETRPIPFVTGGKHRNGAVAAKLGSIDGSGIEACSKQCLAGTVDRDGSRSCFRTGRLPPIVLDPDQLSDADHRQHYTCGQENARPTPTGTQHECNPNTTPAETDSLLRAHHRAATIDVTARCCG